MSFPRRAEIYWVSLDPVIGSEIAKTRPAVIVSNDVGNEYSRRVMVAPLSSQGTERTYPFEVVIPAGESGLVRTSKVLLDQIRSVDKSRLGNFIGVVSPGLMAEVNRAIRRSLAV